MHALTTAAIAAAPAADDAPSFFKTASFSAFGGVIFGLILIVVAIIMAWNSRHGKVKQNGNIVANVGLAALVFVLGLTAALFPAIKDGLGYFFNF